MRSVQKSGMGLFKSSLQRLVGLDGAIFGDPTQHLSPLRLGLKHSFVDEQVRKLDAFHLGFRDRFAPEPAFN